VNQRHGSGNDPEGNTERDRAFKTCGLWAILQLEQLNTWVIEVPKGEAEKIFEKNNSQNFLNMRETRTHRYRFVPQHKKHLK
jgi:hypothetical protein